MRRSNFALRLQPSLFDELRGIVAAEDVTINQFINVAVAEKLAALRTQAYFRKRAAKSDIPGALRILDRLGVSNPPLPDDKLAERGRKGRRAAARMQRSAGGSVK